MGLPGGFKVSVLHAELHMTDAVVMAAGVQQSFEILARHAQALKPLVVVEALGEVQGVDREGELQRAAQPGKLAVRDAVELGQGQGSRSISRP